MAVAGLAAGIVGGTTTMLTRRAARRAMYRKGGDPRLPRRARERQGFLAMLAWAAAAGIILAVADVLIQQRRESLMRERTERDVASEPDARVLASRS